MSTSDNPPEKLTRTKKAALDMEQTQRRQRILRIAIPSGLIALLIILRLTFFREWLLPPKTYQFGEGGIPSCLIYASQSLTEATVEGRDATLTVDPGYQWYTVTMRCSVPEGLAFGPSPEDMAVTDSQGRTHNGYQSAVTYWGTDYQNATCVYYFPIPQDSLGLKLTFKDQVVTELPR